MDFGETIAAAVASAGLSFLITAVVSMVSLAFSPDLEKVATNELFTTPTLENTQEIIHKNNQYVLYKSNNGVVESVFYGSFEIDGEAKQPYEVISEGGKSKRWYRFGFFTHARVVELFVPNKISILKIEQAEDDNA